MILIVIKGLFFSVCITNPLANFAFPPPSDSMLQLVTDGDRDVYEFIDDEILSDAISFMISTRSSSINAVQRNFRIGYDRAAKIVNSAYIVGVITDCDHEGNRDLVISNVQDGMRAYKAYLSNCKDDDEQVDTTNVVFLSKREK